jgi:hypothetical protein
VGLGVTGIIPAGFWVIVGVVYYKLRSMS